MKTCFPNILIIFYVQENMLNNRNGRHGYTIDANSQLKIPKNQKYVASNVERSLWSLHKIIVHIFIVWLHE